MVSPAPNNTAGYLTDPTSSSGTRSTAVVRSATCSSRSLRDGSAELLRSNESTNKEVCGLESQIHSLKLEKPDPPPSPSTHKRRTATIREIDWSQFGSLKPLPFFHEFLPLSTAIPNGYVHNATRFHPFPRLPTEIRLQVWELARPSPQVVRLKRKKNGGGIYSINAIPGIMQACKESRSWGLEKWYPLNKNFHDTKQASKGEKPICFYFDPKIDYVFKGCELCNSICFCIPCRTIWPPWIKDKIQRMILQGKYAETFTRPGVPETEPFSVLGYEFPGLKELILLNPDCPAGEISKIPLTMDNLVESDFEFEWQEGGSLLDLSVKHAASFDATWKLLSGKDARPFELEKAVCMELAVTPQTNKAYGFMKLKFEYLYIMDVLETPIPGHRPLGMTYSTWRRLTSNDPIRPSKKELKSPDKQLSEEQRLKRHCFDFEIHTIIQRRYRNNDRLSWFAAYKEHGNGKKRKQALVWTWGSVHSKRLKVLLY